MYIFEWFLLDCCTVLDAPLSIAWYRLACLWCCRCRVYPPISTLVTWPGRREKLRLLIKMCRFALNVSHFNWHINVHFIDSYSPRTDDMHIPIEYTIISISDINGICDVHIYIYICKILMFCCEAHFSGAVLVYLWARISNIRPLCRGNVTCHARECGENEAGNKLKVCINRKIPPAR